MGLGYAGNVKWPSIHCVFQRLLLRAAVVGLACASLRAASPDDHWDSTFGVPGVNDSGVSCFAYRGNDFFVGGTFTSIGGVSATNIARFDGTNWNDVGGGISGMDSGLSSMVLFGGDLVVAGFFSLAGAAPANHLARWNGTNWFSLGSGVDNVVFALASDGQSIYAGGHFTNAGGIAASKIARWNGSNWFSLGSGIIPVTFGGAQVGAVDSLTVQGNNVIVGGRFRNAGGLGATNIAGWDGTNWYTLGYGLRAFDGPGAGNGVVRTMAAIGTNLFAGGNFRIAGNVQAANVARWNGSAWTPVGSGVNDSLSVLSLAANGNELYAGGSFQAIGGMEASRIAKWNGVSWTNLGTGVGAGLGDGVRSLLSSGSELYVGGYFPTAGGKPANNIALWRIPHALSMSCAEEAVTLSWPATGSNFVVEAKENVAGTNWSVVSTNPALVGDQCRVTNQIDSPARFFRLRRK